jgi:hypothetical protein
MNSLIFITILFPYNLTQRKGKMRLLGLGILLGICIYWAMAVILVKRISNRHIENKGYLTMALPSEVAKDEHQKT